MSIEHYDFMCPSCGLEYKDLSEGAVNYGNDSLYNIYVCKSCTHLKEYSQHDSHKCHCGNDMVKWNYKCPVCNTLMIKEETGIYDVW